MFNTARACCAHRLFSKITSLSWNHRSIAVLYLSGTRVVIDSSSSLSSLSMRAPLCGLAFNDDSSSDIVVAVFFFIVLLDTTAETREVKTREKERSRRRMKATANDYPHFSCYTPSLISSCLDLSFSSAFSLSVSYRHHHGVALICHLMFRITVLDAIRLRISPLSWFVRLAETRYHTCHLLRYRQRITHLFTKTLSPSECL